MSSNFQQNFAPLDNWIRFEIGRHPLKSDGQKVWNYSYDYYKIEDHIEEDEVVPPVGVFFGKGDGGHGPTHEELQQMPLNLGFTKWSTADKFFEDLEQYKDKLPVWDDGTLSRIPSWNF